MYTDYIDKHNKTKGFSIVYGGGDFCESSWSERKVQFDMICDPAIDFEVRTMLEEKCYYTFKIYTNQACGNAIIPPQSYHRLGFIGRVISFYYGLFLMGLSLAYYCLVGFVIYCIFRVVAMKMENPSTSVTKSLPYKERLVYLYNRIKSYFI